MLEHQKHIRITRNLKRSLLIIIGFGVLMAGLLVITVGLVNYNIAATASYSKQVADQNLKILIQSQQKFSLPENTSYAPTTLDPTTLIGVVARNQPSVVRIVTIYCADITLVDAKVTANFADTCSGLVGSGSFISSDGYIATSGHVVSIAAGTALVDSLTSSSNLSRYLEFLVLSGLISSHEANVIKTGMATKDATAKTALYATINLVPQAQIHADNSTTQFAIQLSDIPIQLTKESNRLAPIYNDTVIKASLIDMDFDQVTSDKAIAGKGQFASSDVAVLKATGSFPYISLGSIDSVKTGDQLTAIGFPAEITGVDSTLTQKVPTITQGKVTAIRYDSSERVRKIIDTTVQLGQGDSGGPALNDAGQQIGLNTYSAIDCPDLKCYGNGEVRDIADLKALLDRDDIALSTGGVIDDWSTALTAYAKGDYKKALDYLTKVKKEYPANYLVDSLLNVATQQQGSSSDTSSSYQAQGVVTIALIVLAISIVVVSIILISLILIFTIKLRRLMRRQEAKQTTKSAL